MIVYKAVRKFGIGFFSAINHQCPLYYEVGEWTFPKIGKIFAFDSFENAKAYCGSYREIFEAEASGVEPIATIASLEHRKAIKNFWEDRLRDNQMALAPNGSVVCAALKLVRKYEVQTTKTWLLQ